MRSSFEIFWFLVWQVIFLLKPEYLGWYVLRLLILFKYFILLGFHWLHFCIGSCRGGERVPPHYMQVGVCMWIPQLVFVYPRDGRVSLLVLEGCGRLAPYWATDATTLTESGWSDCYCPHGLHQHLWGCGFIFIGECFDFLLTNKGYHIHENETIVTYKKTLIQEKLD